MDQDLSRFTIELEADTAGITEILEQSMGTRVCAWLYVCMYVCVYVHVCACTVACVCVFVYGCVVFVFVDVRMCVCSWSILMHIICMYVCVFIYRILLA